MNDYATQRLNQFVRQSSTKVFLVGFAFFLGITTSFTLGVIASQRGFFADWQEGVAVTTPVNPSDVVLKNQSHPSGEVDFGEFWKAWALVQEQHVEAPFSQQDLMQGAIKGMVAATGDPHTIFWTNEETEEFTASLNGNFGGVGIEIEPKGDELVILSTLKDTPAEKAGLQPGDVILAVDETSTINMSVYDVVLAIRGEEGTKVKIAVRRQEEVKEFSITRATVTVPTLEAEMLENGVGYIRLYQFSDKIEEEYDQAVATLTEQQPKGIILDLRYNTGGYYKGGVYIADSLLTEGDIVAQRRRGGVIVDQQTADDREVFASLPVVVLVNQFSASAAEIVALAIQEHGRATLVGTPTFGKGSVQEILPIYPSNSDSPYLKITNAHWISPNGNHLDPENPIQPDVVVEQAPASSEDASVDSDDSTATPVASSEEYGDSSSTDLQLQKAKEVLQEKIENTTPTPIPTPTPSPVPTTPTPTTTATAM